MRGLQQQEQRDAGQALAWIDGRIGPASEARIPILDHGLLYGDGLFEGMRVYGGALFRLEAHLRRMRTGADALGLEIPGGTAALESIVLETARAYGRQEAYVRLILTRGVGELGVDPTVCEEPRIICIVSPIRLYPQDKLERGIDLITSSLRRPAADVLDPSVKSLNYLNSVLAKREARLRGADEALLLNAQGRVAEASVANVFCVRDGLLTTPPVVDGALPGITRASILEIAADEEIPAREASLGRTDLIGADEVFLTGSGARIVPVASLDGAPIGRTRGRGAMTARISDCFARFVLAHGTPF